MEKYIGVVGPVSGHTYDTLYDLIFTTERLIAINTNHPTDTTYTFQLSDLLIGRKLANKSEKVLDLVKMKQAAPEYASMDWNALLKERRFSFTIPISRISSTDVKKGLFKTSLRCHITTTSNETKTIRFHIPKKKCADLEGLLAKFIGSNPQCSG